MTHLTIITSLFVNIFGRTVIVINNDKENLMWQNTWLTFNHYEIQSRLKEGLFEYILDTLTLSVLDLYGIHYPPPDVTTDCILSFGSKEARTFYNTVCHKEDIAPCPRERSTFEGATLPRAQTSGLYYAYGYVYEYEFIDKFKFLDIPELNHFYEPRKTKYL